ncbi:MAG: hypothetical protein KKE59_04060, partial [Proteobacteria bacterium]|nr:hypothetical protein [Pseudomonadota bacterium]
MLNTTLVVIGVIAGVLLGWLLASLRTRSFQDRLEDELREQIAAKDEQINATRSREAQLIAEKSAAITARESAEQQLAELRRQAGENEARIDQLQNELRIGSNALSKSQADLEAARNLLADKEALYEKQLKESKEAQD